MKQRSLVLLTLLLIGLALGAWMGSALFADSLMGTSEPTWQAPIIQTLTATPTVTPGWWQQLASPTPQSTTPIP